MNDVTSATGYFGSLFVLVVTMDEEYNSDKVWPFSYF